MGKYINKDSKGNVLPSRGKAQCLIADGATVLPKPPSTWEDGLVCVVSNGAFEAAAYAYCENEMLAFQDPGDPRPFVWLKYANAKALAK